jgi:predicted RNase H-like HicB family nuclease
VDPSRRGVTPPDAPPPVAYLDSSALIKLVVVEAESGALRRELVGWPQDRRRAAGRDPPGHRSQHRRRAGARTYDHRGPRTWAACGHAHLTGPPPIPGFLGINPMSTPDRNSYLILIETGPNNYSAWSPDLPGCVSTGPTVAATAANMREAMQGHLEVIAEYGEAIPEPTGPGVYVEQHTVAAA